MPPSPTGDRAGRLSSWVLWTPAVLVSGLLLLPLAYLLVRALGADVSVLTELVWRRRSLVLLLNTLALAVSVLVVATVISLPLAWLVTRTELWGRKALTILGILPLAIPGYVTAFVLLSATGPTGALASITGIVVDRASGFGGALWALSVYTFPYLFLNLRTGLGGLDPSLEESARALGHSRWSVFRNVVWPQLRPAYLSGALLIVLHVIGDFGVVSLMRFETLSYALYLQYAGAFDRVYAAWIAIGLLGITSIILVMESRLLSRFHASSGASRKHFRERREPLHRGKVLAYLFAAIVAAQCLLLPVGTLLFWAGDWLSIDLSGLGEALGNSLIASIPSAVAAVALALPIAYIAVRRTGPASRFVERMAWYGYATPPLAFALALILFSIRLAPPLYQTFGLLVAAYCTHFLAEAVGPIRTRLLQTPIGLQEAARGLGRGPIRAFSEITLPLLRPGMLTAAAFVFLAVMKELPITFLLSPIGFETLAITVWTYTSEAQYALAAPYAMVVVAFSAAFVGLLIARDRKRSSNG